MLAPFFDVFLPSLGADAAAVGKGGAEALLGAPDIGIQRQLKLAEAGWYGKRGGAGHNALQTLQFIAATNPAMFEQMMANPAFLWALTTRQYLPLQQQRTQTEEARRQLLGQKGETEEDRQKYLQGRTALTGQHAQSEGQRLENLRSTERLIGAREEEVRGRTEATRQLTGGKLGVLRNQADLLTARILDLQDTGELRRDLLEAKIAEMGLTGAAKRDVLAQTKALLKERGDLVGEQMVTELLRQDVETSRETELEARTERTLEQTRTEQALRPLRTDREAMMVETYKNRAAYLEQQLKFAETADPLRATKLKEQIAHERAMTKYWQERGRYAAEQAKQGPRGASTAPQVSIRPDIIGKPQVQQTFKGPQAEQFNEAYQFWRNALADVQGDLASARTLRSNFYRLKHDLPVKSAFEQAWTELFGTKR